ncbi:MAG TPA: DUF1801 domain-containing protein [Allosphingosinicella sp.]|nr:DUF1801 domain-containing protein [Allosphingosinicella sp.]
MAENKTKATGASVDAFIDAVPDPQRREDARTILALMERLSGEPAAMWGPSIIGFGRYHYKYDSGHEGESARLAFSPRAKELVLYLLGDIPRQQELLDRLGRHRSGKCCLYIKRLSDVDQTVLEELVRESLAYMDAKYPR